MRWNPANKKWYEGKGYIFTNYKDEFNVLVGDMSDGSKVMVNVKCDGCSDILNGIEWRNYKKYVYDDGKYYCRKCSKKLPRNDSKPYKINVNVKSFEEWCLVNNHQDLLYRWDYDVNTLKPNEINFSSQGHNRNGYWFKCLEHPEHESELKNIHNFVRSGYKGSIECKKCNSVSITHPDLVKYFVNKEDTLKYSSGSFKEVTMKCPDCNYEKKIRVGTLIWHGLSCHRCSDGVSYPEKFMLSFLEQLNSISKFQLSKTTFKWCKNYRYDFYIDSLNCIIETHGGQHYKDTLGFWGSLKEIKKNDNLKKELANENSINSYIVIDCRYSKMEFIRNNIMISELPKLLNFKESDIDWFRCHEYSCKSLVKVACDLWNNRIRSISNISKELKLSKSTILRYLKQGFILNWCDYNPKKLNS